ncbi:MAG: hypothetical protein ABIR71_14295 [Chthoniobacterales bacterium]
MGELLQRERDIPLRTSGPRVFLAKPIDAEVLLESARKFLP